MASTSKRTSIHWPALMVPQGQYPELRHLKTGWMDRSLGIWRGRFGS
jgi:hypothetical protein